MDFYLLEFRLKGIKNIEKEITINFYKQDIRKFNRENYNVKGIFGRNGIGKSTLFKLFLNQETYQGKISKDVDFIKFPPNLSDTSN